MPNIDKPLYSGARAQLGHSPRPVDIPDIASRANQQALQSGSGAVDGALNSFYKIQDFGENEKIENNLQNKLVEFDAEFDRRANLASGSDDSLFDANGKLLENQLNNLVFEYANKANDIKGNFITPEAQFKAESMKRRVVDSLAIRAYGKAGNLSIQRTRQAFNENLDYLGQVKDYASRAQKIAEGNKAGIISDTAANALSYDNAQEGLAYEFKSLLNKDPEQAAKALQDGHYDGLEAGALIKAKAITERALEEQTKPIPLTAQELEASRNGRPVRQKFAVRNGATEEEYAWRDYYDKNGHFGLYEEEINSRLRSEIDAAPVLKSEGERKAWVKKMVKTYCDPKTGYGVDPYEVEIIATRKMEEANGLIDKSNSVDVGALLKQFSDEQIAPVWSAKAKAANNERKPEKLAELAKARSSVETKVKNAMDVWMTNNPKADFSKQMSQTVEFLNLYAKSYYTDNKGILLPKTLKEAQANTIDALKGVDLRDKKGLGAVGYQQDKNKKWNDNQKAAQKPITPKTTAYEEMQLSVVRDERVGIYVPSKRLAALTKEGGGSLYAKIKLANGAYTKVPVLGSYEGEGEHVEVTSATARKLAKLDPRKGAISYVNDAYAPEAKYETRTAYQKSMEDEGLLPPPEGQDEYYQEATPVAQS